MKIQNNKATFALTQEFDTIICSNCLHEYLLFSVHRLDTGEYRDEPTFWSQIRSHYCPYCGASLLTEIQKGVK